MAGTGTDRDSDPGTGSNSDTDCGSNQVTGDSNRSADRKAAGNQVTGSDNDTDCGDTYNVTYSNTVCICVSQCQCIGKSESIGITVSNAYGYTECHANTCKQCQNGYQDRSEE